MKEKKILSNASIHDRIGVEATMKLSKSDIKLIELRDRVKALINFNSGSHLKEVIKKQSTLEGNKNISEMSKVR